MKKKVLDQPSLIRAWTIIFVRVLLIIVSLVIVVWVLYKLSTLLLLLVLSIFFCYLVFQLFLQLCKAFNKIEIIIIIRQAYISARCQHKVQFCYFFNSSALTKALYVLIITFLISPLMICACNNFNILFG